MAGRDLARLGCALALGMALAFPAGLMVAGNRADRAPPSRGAASTAERRDVFSPRILDDPYFLEQQRRNVEALEAHCRESGESCVEAGQARRWLDRQD